jgi:hypothetical protein
VRYCWCAVACIHHTCVCVCVRVCACVRVAGIAVISIVSTLFVYLMTDLHSGAGHFFIFFVDLFLSLVRP